MAVVDYGQRPLVLPLADGGDDFDLEPVVVSKQLEFAERFRRQGRKVSWLFVGTGKWGKANYPIRLRLDDAEGKNRRYWYRDAEPIDLTAWATLPSSWLPHHYWKWRITVEPAGLAGKLYDIWNPDGVGGASVMAEDLVTMGGVMTGVPIPFSAPGQHPNRVGNLQLGYTDDGGTTIYWCNPIWN